MTAAPALELEDVSASYGAYRALFDVSFTVEAGEAVALLGSNGAGKSTVARVVSGLLPPTAGRLLLDGRDRTGERAFQLARAGVAHVVEGRGVFSRLSVEENLVLAFSQRAGRSRVPEALEQAYAAFPVLAGRRTQKGGTLSGGEQRMLSLAKALVVRPRLLVADELSLGLAPAVIDAVYENLARIHARGTALLVVEQHLDRVLGLAARAVVLEHGAVAYTGPASEAVQAVEDLMAARGRAAAG
jgi:branched-chain amino acid transport system ATP-binding protein